MKLSIVIPAYNEEKRIEPTLDTYLDYFKEKYGDDFELVIVVNGSIDRTAQIADAYAGQYAQVHSIVEPKKIGKGGAVIRGFEAAEGDIIGFTDADGSTPADALEDLVERLRNSDADAVIASRWFKESVVEPRQTWRRRLASRVFNFLVRTLFGLRIWDTQCGAKVMRRDALKTVLPRLGLTQWAFDVDLLFQLKRDGRKIIEAPTVWHDVGGSQLRIGNASMQMLLAITRLRLLYSPFDWVVKVYDCTLGPLIHLRM
jgi:glycosyltransferase involved in cell wall biosynthesis